MSIDDSLPTDLASAHALIIAQRQALSAAELRATAAESEAQCRALLIEKLKFTIRKLRHDRFGQSSERGALLDQLELQLADLEADAAQAEAVAQMATGAASEMMMVRSFERRRPARRPLPEHLPRERIVYPAPSACPCCGGTTLRKIGEDVTETLELIRASGKWSSMCARSSPAGPAKRSASLQSHRTDRARPRRTEAARPHPILQYGLHLRFDRRSATYAGRRRSRRLDAGRLGPHRGGDADAAGRGDPDPCLSR